MAALSLGALGIVLGDIGTSPLMAKWRKKLFIAIARNAAGPVPYFHLPDERTVVMASHVEL